MTLPPPPALPPIWPYLSFTTSLNPDQDSSRSHPSSTAFSAFHSQNQRNRGADNNKHLSDLDREEFALQAKVTSSCFLTFSPDRSTRGLRSMDNSICGHQDWNHTLRRGIMLTRIRLLPRLRSMRRLLRSMMSRVSQSMRMRKKLLTNTMSKNSKKKRRNRFKHPPRPLSLRTRPELADF
jgi:hypothetical protein